MTSRLLGQVHVNVPGPSQSPLASVRGHDASRDDPHLEECPSKRFAASNQRQQRETTSPTGQNARQSRIYDANAETPGLKGHDVPDRKETACQTQPLLIAVIVIRVKYSHSIQPQKAPMTLSQDHHLSSSHVLGNPPPRLALSALLMLEISCQPVIVMERPLLIHIA